MIQQNSSCSADILVEARLYKEEFYDNSFPMANVLELEGRCQISVLYSCRVTLALPVLTSRLY